MTATNDKAAPFVADPVLLKAIIDGVTDCLTSCGTKARCVGVSAIPTHEPGSVTGLIGVHGDVSGFVTVNMAERVARAAVGGLLQEQFDTLTPQIIDGVGEMTNIIAGGIKKGLSGSPWGFSHVTVPSVIIGRNYQIAYCRNLIFLSVTFEHQDPEVLMLEDRLLQVSVSLIRV
jgi:chemotaxis protein CheX